MLQNYLTNLKNQKNIISTISESEIVFLETLAVS